MYYMVHYYLGETVTVLLLNVNVHVCPFEYLIFSAFLQAGLKQSLHQYNYTIMFIRVM